MAANILDIKSDKWVSLILRLQRIGKTQWVNKYKLIRITVICDQEGNPVGWPEPHCIPIEAPGGDDRKWIHLLSD